ncbi:transposase [Nocardiopsis gilva YIM 90087]|uniref:Transposase n=1 Tax=Nocardiopsis gilva YIM 90087 TaxID=1235441 RepID=A0A223S5S8_9ACTN|nr:RNA-guided endonuclease TnpB family protein [Nocardiopsis gilva]ASU83379.1 transposase [Nocardiopsis gilva YIM 90087]
MLTGYRYRLTLTPEQDEQCRTYGDICRAVWNTALDQRRQAVKRWERGQSNPFPGYAYQCGQLKEATTEEEWLKTVPAQTLQQTLKDLDAACARHGTFKVHWRTKHRWKPSFRFPDGKNIQMERLGRRWGRLKLPKLGWVRFRWSRAPRGAVRSATVRCESGHWIVSLLCEDGTAAPEVHAAPTTSVGIDRGVTVAVATSDGDLFDRQFQTSKEAERERRLRQRLSRQRMGSASRARTRAQLSRLTGRVRDRRADFQAQTAKPLCAKNAVVVLEALNTSGMVRSVKGTVSAPGRGVRAKAGLNRTILAKGWHAFEVALANAARRTGTTIVEVDPAYTSQTCHGCGHVEPGNRESQAVFRCKSCGHTENADVNAAKNVNAAGLAVSACGDLAVGRSVKQEPPSRLAPGSGWNPGPLKAGRTSK